jgi:hypothetical protein
MVALVHLHLLSGEVMVFGQQVLLVRLDQQALKVLKVLPVQLAQQDHKAHRDQLVQQDRKARKAHKVELAQQDHKAHKVRPVQQAQQVHKEHKEHKALRVQLDLLDLLDPLVLLVHQFWVQAILGLAQIFLMPIKILDLVRVLHYKHMEQQVEQ